MKTIATTLGISRSNLYEQTSDATRPPLSDKRGRPLNSQDAALLRRELAAEGLPPVNHKKVYRLMQMQGFLLERHSGRRPGRTHDGKVVVVASNRRWCSDALEFACWNGEIVRVGAWWENGPRTVF